MSLPNGSIANLLVTRKSLVARNLRHVPFLFRFPYGEGLADESANKKAGAGRGASAEAEIKSRRWKGAGMGSKDFPAALGGERIAR